MHCYAGQTYTKIIMLWTEQAISKLSCASFSKRGFVQNFSNENEFYLHVNENSFSYKRLCSKTCFEKEVQDNSVMAYYT